METDARRQRAAKDKQRIEAAKDPDALLTIDTVSALTGYAPRTIRRMVLEGSFPAPVQRRPRMTRWLARHVRTWLVEQQVTRPA